MSFADVTMTRTRHDLPTRTRHQVGLSQDVYSAKEVFIRLIGEIRAQEQAKKEARAAPKTPESGEKRKVCLHGPTTAR